MIEESDAEWEARMMRLLDEAGAPVHDGRGFLVLHERMAALEATHERIVEEMKAIEAEFARRGLPSPALADDSK